MSDDLMPAAEPEAPDSFGAEPAEPTVAEKSEAALDEAIDKALGPDEDEEPAEKSAKKGAKAEVDEDDDGAAPDEDEELEELPGDDDDLEDAADDGAKASDEEEEEADEDDDDMALHRAYTRLHEKGIPAKVLKRTPKDELIAWADRVGDEKAKSDEPASKTAQGRETSDGAKETGKPASAWAVMRSVLAEKLGIDEDAADAMKPLHDANEALQARLDALEARTVQRDGQVTIDKEMRRLGAQYGSTLRRDSEKQESILDKASTIVAGLKARGAEINVRKAFDEAARAVMNGAPKPDLSAKKRNGVSAPPERVGNSRTAPLDEESYWSRGVDLAMSGKGVDAIKRLRPPTTMKPTRGL